MKSNLPDPLTLDEFLALHGAYRDDIYGDYQDYIETQQARIMPRKEFTWPEEN